jgi:hypothetical protein
MVASVGLAALCSQMILLGAKYLPLYERYKFSAESDREKTEIFSAFSHFRHFNIAENVRVFAGSCVLSF